MLNNGGYQAFSHSSHVSPGASQYEAFSDLMPPNYNTNQSMLPSLGPQAANADTSQMFYVPKYGNNS